MQDPIDVLKNNTSPYQEIPWPKEGVEFTLSSLVNTSKGQAAAGLSFNDDDEVITEVLDEEGGVEVLAPGFGRYRYCLNYPRKQGTKVTMIDLSPSAKPEILKGYGIRILGNSNGKLLACRDVGVLENPAEQLQITKRDTTEEEREKYTLATQKKSRKLDLGAPKFCPLDKPSRLPPLSRLGPPAKMLLASEVVHEIFAEVDVTDFRKPDGEPDMQSNLIEQRPGPPQQPDAGRECPGHQVRTESQQLQAPTAARQGESVIAGLERSAPRKEFRRTRQPRQRDDGTPPPIYNQHQVTDDAGNWLAKQIKQAAGIADSAPHDTFPNSSPPRGDLNPTLNDQSYGTMLKDPSPFNDLGKTLSTDARMTDQNPRGHRGGNNGRGRGRGPKDADRGGPRGNPGPGGRGNDRGGRGNDQGGRGNDQGGRGNDRGVQRGRGGHRNGRGRNRDERQSEENRPQDRSHQPEGVRGSDFRVLESRPQIGPTDASRRSGETRGGRGGGGRSRGRRGAPRGDHTRAGRN